MRKLVFIVLVAALFACETRERPKEILTDEQLSAFLVDIYLAEARLDAVPRVKDSIMRLFVPFEQKLLKKHGIADSILRPTYTYYMAHPKELEKVYDSVIDTLALREQRAGTRQTRSVQRPVE
ncbi:hypothetical protein WSM22_33730 [Cytophagales bacterium WSM2-2]|nr:hypothetical protein WSM22_33730 [Cytophagales bacterium WSM2-2]